MVNSATPAITLSVDINMAGMEFCGQISNHRITASWKKGERDIGFRFADIPLLASVAGEKDGIFVEDLVFCYDDNVDFAVRIILRVNGNEFNITIPHNYDEVISALNADVPKSTAAEQPSNDAVNMPPEKPPPAETVGEIKWFELNKTIAFLNFRKIGFSTSGGCIKLYVTAAVKISVLEVELYEFGATLPLGGNKFGISLKGMGISFNKPPFSISGGLYKSEYMGNDIYNGSLSLRIKDLSISAIGSYTTVEGSPSFFVYAFVGYPIGGPAFFFVTGLALGFGINRAIKMPELSKVPEFPLVKSVTSPKESKLANTSDPGVALDELSNWVYPLKGNYFAAAGVRFTSFSVLKSFALLIVEFGARFRITLMGQCVLTMPLESSSPILYIKLLFRAYYDSDTGYIEFKASISKDSFFLSEKCLLQGGMAVCVWTKGERAGDFIVMIGGCHHPLFKDKGKYPKLDKIGINWKISNKISLKGQGYFAVTHSCAMGGVDISIDYSSSNLAVWFRASASFYVKWKPLFYDVRLSIRIGAKFKLDLGLYTISKTIEVGASLHLWGPDFSGTVTIDCSFFSVTISFGADASEPKKLKWDEFYEAFLPQGLTEKTGQHYSNDTCRLTTLNVTEGVIKEASDTLYIKGDALAFTVNATVPCTSMNYSIFGVKKTLVYDKKCGIVPMKEESFECNLFVSITKSDGEAVFNPDCLSVTSSKDNINSAVWGKKYNPGGDLIRNVTTGFNFKFDVTAQIKNVRGPYLFEDLRRFNKKNFCWEPTPEKTEAVSESFYQCGFYNTTARSNRIFSELSEIFGTYDSAHYREDIKKEPQSYFWDEPFMCRVSKSLR